MDDVQLVKQSTSISETTMRLVYNLETESHRTLLIPPSSLYITQVFLRSMILQSTQKLPRSCGEESHIFSAFKAENQKSSSLPSIE